MAKKSYTYQGHVFEDNGHGDLYNGEVDRFLIFRPYPMMVQTVMHKDDSVTMSQEKFKENTDKNQGVYEEGYEVNDDGSVFVKAEDVTQNIKEESKDNRTDVSEEAIDDNIEIELDSDDREKLEGLIGYGIPQDVADEFQEITGEESQAIENAIGLLADDLIGYEEFNDFEEEYGNPGDYDRLDNLEYDLSEYMGNHDIDEDLKTQIERYIGDAEEQATQDIEEEIQNYLDGHTVKVEEQHVAGEELYSDDPNRYGDLREYNERMNPSEVLPNEQEYRFDFGFKDGSSLRSDSFEEAKAYLEEEDMAQYLDEPLKSKIDSVKWVLDDESSVHVDVKSNQPLYKEDMDALKDFIEGQNSDGLGEGFEQQKFAESYYDPDTGEGPYSYQEMMDIVQENYDNMDVDEWIDYIGEDDLAAAEDEYIDMNYDVDDIISAIETDYDIDEDEHERLSNMDMGDISMELQDRYPDAEYHIRENARQELMDDPESYLDDNAIGTAKDEVARNDARYNETLWGDGMTSMEWDIPDGVNVTKPVDDSYSREEAAAMGVTNADLELSRKIQSLPMNQDEYNEFQRKIGTQEGVSFLEYRMEIAKDRYEKGYNANELSYQDLKDIQDYREMKEIYEPKGQVISDRYIENPIISEEESYTITVDDGESITNIKARGIDEARTIKDDQKGMGEVRLYDSQGGEIIEDKDSKILENARIEYGYDSLNESNLRDIASTGNRIQQDAAENKLAKVSLAKRMISEIAFMSDTERRDLMRSLGLNYKSLNKWEGSQLYAILQKELNKIIDGR